MADNSNFRATLRERLARWTSAPFRLYGGRMSAQRDSRSILSSAEWERVARALQLSPRELELLKCCFDDLSERRVADALEISRHTVHTYVRRLYRKAGVRSRVELVLPAVAIARSEPQESEARRA